MTIKKNTIFTLISVLIITIVIMTGVSFFQFTLIQSNENTISAEDITNSLEEIKKDEEESSSPAEIDEDNKPTNSYDILAYAYNNIYDETNLVMTTETVSGKLGFDQNIKSIYKRSGVESSTETFAYGNAAFLKCFYEYCYTNDETNCQYIFTNNIDENYNYDISGSNIQELTLDYIRENIRPTMMQCFTLIPSKSSGIVTSFDRISDSDYYIIKFTFTTIPAFYSENYKTELNSTYISFQSITLTSYIEKSTCRLKLVEKYENYSFNASPVGEMTVSLSGTYKFQYPKTLKIEPLK